MSNNSTFRKNSHNVKIEAVTGLGFGQKAPFVLRQSLKNNISKICLGISLLSLPALAPSASAQTVDQVEPYDEIIVQARKRDESVQDVPASISALSDKDAESLVLDGVDDYIRQTAGAILVSAGPAYLNDIALRGQGGGRLGFSESTTGIYRDGIFIAGGGFGGRSYSKIDFFDMKNFEVYRGPQGALYGRNAVGGAANIITRKPTAETEARVKATYTDQDSLELEGVVNIPLSENGINMRVGGYTLDQKDGFHTLETTGEVVDVKKDWGVRGALSAELSPVSKLTLSVETSSSEAPGFASLGQNLKLDADPFVRVGLDRIDVVEIDQTSLFGEFTHKFDAADLTVLANFKERDGARVGGDLDHFLGFNTPALALLDEQSEGFKRHGVEVRLASNGSHAYTWLVGADYQTYTSDVISERTGTFAGPFAASAPLRRQLRRDLSTEELDSFSAFGLVGFQLSQALELTVEARVQDDQKTYDYERIDLDSFTDDTVPLSQFEFGSTKFLPSISLAYQIPSGSNLYARASTGYRPGGFNPQPQVGFFDQVPYGSESVYSFEAGWKANFQIAGIRLKPEIAGFYTHTDDVQTTSFLTTTTTTPALQNVGDARVIGVEASVRSSLDLWGGMFNTNASISFADGKFLDGASVIANGVLHDLTDARTPRNRDYIVALNGMYVRPLKGALTGYVSGSFQAEGGGYDNAIGSLNVAGSRSSDSFERIDLKLGIRTEMINLSVFGKNITDEIYRTVTLNGNDYHAAGRVYGVSLGINY